MDAIEVYEKLLDEGAENTRDFLTISGNTNFRIQLCLVAIEPTATAGHDIQYLYKKSTDNLWRSLTAPCYSYTTSPMILTTMTNSNVLVNTGLTISFKTSYLKFFENEEGTDAPPENRWINFYISGTSSLKLEVYGNILSLNNYSTISKRIFQHLFWKNSKITHSSGIIMPNTTAEECYAYMFAGCIIMSSAPALPATNLNPYCYMYMFSSCSDLKTPPALPATTVPLGCYMGMFRGCSDMTTAPALPALVAQNNCYKEMFGGCNYITTAPALPATILGNSCYEAMFSGCTRIATPPPELPAVNLKPACYKEMFKYCISLTTPPGLTANTVELLCCYAMFSGCAKLTNINTIQLNATTLYPHCYAYMFKGCTTAVGYPTLPAMTMAPGCYMGMYANCLAQTTISDNYLPATTLAPSCYYMMFSECKNLTQMPTLPATEMADYCYASMFYWCNLQTIDSGKLSGTLLALYCFSQMFSMNLNLTSIHQNNCFSHITAAHAWSFSQMFNSCQSLQYLPDGFLANMNYLAIYCCYEMFVHCIALKEGPKSIPATMAEEGCFVEMFYNCPSLLSAFPLLAYSSIRLGKNCYAGMFNKCTSLKAISSYADSWEKTVNGEYMPFTSGNIPEFGMVFDGWVSGVPEQGTYYYNPALSGNNDPQQGPLKPDLRIKVQGDYVHIPYNWNLVALGSSSGGGDEPTDDDYIWDNGTYDYVVIDDDGTKRAVVPVPNTGWGNFIVKIGGRKKKLNRIAAGIKLSDFPTGGNGSTFPITNGCGTGGTNWFPTNAGVLLVDLSEIQPLIVYSLNNQDFTLYIKNGNKKGAWLIYIDDPESDSLYETFYNLPAGTGPKHLRGVFITNTENGGGVEIKGSEGAIARIYNIGTTCSISSRKTQIYTLPTTTKVGISGQMEGLSGQMLMNKGANRRHLHQYEFAGLFRNWTALQQISDDFILPFNNLSLNGIIYMNCFEGMFSGCTALTSVPNWNGTLSSSDLTVQDQAMWGMFQGCTSLYDVGFKNHPMNQTPVKQSELYAANVQYQGYQNMFSGCINLTNIYFTQLVNPVDDDYDKSYIFKNMFAGCYRLTNTSNSIKLNPTNNRFGWYSSMFRNCASLILAPTFTTSFTDAASECFNSTFSGCLNLVDADLWNMMPTQSALENSYSTTFADCTSLNLGMPTIESIGMYYDIPKMEDVTYTIRATNVGSQAFKEMFRGCTRLVIAPILNNESVYENSYYYMFAGCTNLQYLINLSFSVNACGYNWLGGVYTAGYYFCVTTDNARYLPSNWNYKLIR